MTTESAAPRETPGDPARTHGEPHSLPLDSTAELLTRITAQLSAQLGRVSRNGTRTPPGSPTPA
ncbi:hypothetical protein ACH4SP_19785 [Streptomyces sp. NPDC021093]|uniref:hypothetical protein n=1 Tax=Streptomyces sp. NPDC021093 TaxID=3365112 RepID=UPI003788A601